MYYLYVDGGRTFECGFFSYKLFDDDDSPINEVQAKKFKLLNLGSRLPKSCPIIDENGNQTNNISEYCAVYFGLDHFIKKFGKSPVTIYHDSELVIRQIAGKIDLRGIPHYQCKSAHLLPWLAEIENLWYPSITYKWVSRKIIVKRLGH